jgi:hypothetical protein
MMIQSVPGRYPRERRPYQRTGTSDSGEVVAEDDPLVRRLEVHAVAQALGGRGAHVVQSHNARRHELGVEAEAQKICAGGREHQPHAVDRLTPPECDAAQTNGRHDGDRSPKHVLYEFSH